MKSYKYIIMCGGDYTYFETPKQMTVIKGEPLVARTIRLLKEKGISDINISSNNPIFDQFGVPRLEHNNSFRSDGENVFGYWIDAYYLTNIPTIYLHGDVYYTEEAIDKIINLDPDQNTFIGNEIARNKEHNNWGEPFGWIIPDPIKFKEDIQKTKELQDNGKLERGYALSWELYRVANNLDPNKMYIIDDTYLSIDDDTIDIDAPWQIEELRNKLGG